MALHAYSHSESKRPALRVVDSPRAIRSLSRTQSAVVAAVAMGVPFLVAVIVLGAGH